MAGVTLLSSTSGGELMRYTMTLAALLLSLTSIVAAQNQPLAFEVASIKPSNPSTNGGFLRPSGDRLTATNVPVKLLVLYAYRAGDGSSFLNNQLFGGPEWLGRLSTTLKGLVQRPVIDRTNLSGLFDFRVRFSTQAIPAFPDRVATDDGLPAPPSDHPLIPILQDELG